MLVGRDLGFSSLALVIVLVCPVIGFVLRRKWRIAAARAEEVKRLLVLASEESARVELEAIADYSTAGPFDSEKLNYRWSTSGYNRAGVSDSDQLKYQWDSTGYSDSGGSTTSQQLQYRCAVCFSPTPRRCARCKSVHYCSGECQIVHWRQGHKDNCHPFTTKQEEHHNIFETEGKHEIFSEESAFAGSDRSNNSNNRDDSEERKTSTSDFKSSSSIKESFASVARRMSSMDASVSNSDNSSYVNNTKKEKPSLVELLNRSVKVNGIKPSSTDQDSQSSSSNSSGWSVDGSSETTFSGVSTSPDFWKGTLRSSLDSGEVIIPRVDLRGSNGSLNNSEIKKSAVSSEEYSKNSLKNNNSPPCSSMKSVPAKSTNLINDTISPSRSYKSRDLNSLASKPSDFEDDFASSIKSVHAKSNSLVNDTISPSRSSKSRDLRSLSSKPLDVEDSGSFKILADSENVIIGLKTSVRKVVDRLKASKSSQIGNIISGKYNYKGLFPYEMFVYLYNWKEVELRPCGLINCGNSCYANAVLQCLTFTPPLSAYLLQRLHSKTCEKNEWCFTCEFESLILKTKEGNSPLSPVRILSRIQNIGSSLSHGREEDAHEFLRYAVDTMKSVCLKEAGAKASSSLGEETTFIDLTFGGLLRSKIRCARCGVKSERDEKMMDLTVEIEGDVGTLEEALRKFTGTEILDGVNKYQCSRCKSYEKARKKLTILEAPNVLTIALKRFQSGNYGKLNKSIQFPEILDLAPYMSETTDTSPIYRLYGVIVHLDMMNAAFSGHYVCFVKNIQNKWFNIDDSMVKPVELDRVLLSKGAYMLLYARCSPHSPKSIRNSIIPQDTRKPKNPAYKSRPQRSGIDLYNDRSIIEDDSWSENSSSMFSESSSGDSCSTETSTRESVTTDDYFDQVMGEFGKIFYGQSDSDTSSSSSYPSPPFLYSESSKHNSSSCRADIYADVAFRRPSTSKRRD